MEDNIAFAEKTVNLLLIEDHLGDVILFKNACQGWVENATIDSVDSVNKAIPLLQSKHFDVIFTDLNTNDSVGPSPVHDLRQAYPNIPIIVLTGVATTLTKEECRKAGATGFMTKAQLDGQTIVKYLETLALV